MKETIIVFFVEGETEIEFYKRLVSFVKAKKGLKSNIKIIYKDMKGIGNYKNKVTRTFEKRIIANYPNSDYICVLCYDSDVFEFGRKPNVDWKKITKELKNLGTRNVIQIEAKQSIEDWFLIDLNGLKKYLKLPSEIKMNYKGQKGIEYLFKKANKVYIKGQRTDGLIDSLDYELIYNEIEDQIEELIELISI